MESGYRFAEGKPEIAISHLLFKDDLRLRFTCSRFKCVEKGKNVDSSGLDLSIRKITIYPIDNGYK